VQKPVLNFDLKCSFFLKALPP